ncbi:MAG: NRDE family protein [Archangium sp.]|nr:NRDE family protein [Archangium sp.]
MCTLIVGFQQHRNVPFWVAANRDELRSRPATPPAWRNGAKFLSPRDEQAGGTWLGLTRAGMFVGVTNRFPSERFLDRESRGQLVLEALEAASALALHAQLSTLSAKRFNTFHLLYADRTAAYVTWSDGEQIHHSVLPPGLHVVTERSLGGDDRGRTALIEAAIPSLERGPEGLPTPLALQQLLARGDKGDPVRGVCVDLPQFDYGSRSSLVMTMGAEPSQTRWWWAEGRPDRTPFVEHPELMAEFSR